MNDNRHQLFDEIHESIKTITKQAIKITLCLSYIRAGNLSIISRVLYIPRAASKELN